MSVLLGSGDGSFQTAIQVRTSPAVIVVVGDFNGDGKPDLAVAGFFSAFVSVLLNTCDSGAPQLAFARSNTHVTVSRAVPTFKFVLESTTNLSLMNWEPAAETCRTNNARLEVTIPFDRQERYFRLRNQ